MGEPYRSVGVLVVEDEILIAMNLQDALTDLGFEKIYLAHTLASGRALLQANTPELSILDVNIRSAPVFPLASELRARDIPIIFSTSYSSRDFPPEWASHPIVPKPLDIATLTTALAAIGFEPKGDGSRPTGKPFLVNSPDSLSEPPCKYVTSDPYA